MPGGRPTEDPKANLLAVRLPKRHLRALRARARTEGVTVSEALRRCLDEWLGQPPRSRRPTADERKTFEQVFAAVGLKPIARRRTKRA